MIEERTKESDTITKYVVIVFGKDSYDILPEMTATINKYNANILNTNQEEFEKNSFMYISIDISNLKIPVNEFSNRIWLRGNDLGFKAYLKKEDTYLTWVRERVSAL